MTQFKKTWLYRQTNLRRSHPFSLFLCTWMPSVLSLPSRRQAPGEMGITKLLSKEFRNFRLLMLPHHSSTHIKVIATVFLNVLILFGGMPQVLFASPRLPNVTPQMGKPEFWVKKIKNPTNPLLTPEKIQTMNEESLRRPDLRLCRIKDLKEDWTRAEILPLLKQDWEDFGRTAEIRYDKSGTPLGELFWDKLRNNLNEGSIKGSGRTLYALVAKKTDIRVFPTAELSMSSPNHYEFDRFQHSAISIGSPVAIYHFSQDEEWAYAQTPFIRGWIRRHDLAIAKERKDAVDYEEAKDRLITTGNTITVFSDPSFQHPEFLAQMGDSFPLLRIPDGNKSADAFYVIQIPRREDNGELSFRKGYIRAKEDVHQGFLAYTQENIARQAFKMLNHPYGWGDRLGGRDCSRFIMDLFRTFGYSDATEFERTGDAWHGPGFGTREARRGKTAAFRQGCPAGHPDPPARSYHALSWQG